MQGRFTAEYETKYEKEIAYKQIPVAIWGATRYGLTKTGNDGVLVGDDGWLFTREEFEYNPKAKAAEERKLNLFADVNGYLDSLGVELVVAIIPAKSRIYSDKLGDIKVPKWRDDLYDRFLTSLHNKNIIAPKLLDKFLEGKKTEKLFMKTDTHWSPAGAAMVATQIDYVTRTSFPNLELKKSAYLSLIAEPENYDGDLSEFIPTGIFKPLIGTKSEPFAKHETSKVENAGQGEGSSDSLFGEVDIDVVLVGTSYSFEKEWNFEGALKEALGTDVLNVSDEGKGPLEPMIDWLKSLQNSAKSHTQNLVIWEIPERFIPKHYGDLELPELLKDNDNIT